MLRLHPTGQVLLSLSGFKGLAATATEPSYFDVVHFWLNGLNGERIQLKAVVLNSIFDPLEDPHRAILSSLPHVKDLQLAHPTSVNDRFSIYILIGADSYWSIVGDESIHGKCPTAVNSFIGYLVSGPLPDTVTPSQGSSYHISAI